MMRKSHIRELTVTHVRSIENIDEHSTPRSLGMAWLKKLSATYDVYIHYRGKGHVKLFEVTPKTIEDVVAAVSRYIRPAIYISDPLIRKRGAS